MSNVTAGATIPSIPSAPSTGYPGNAATNYHFGTAQVLTGLATDLHGSAAGCGGACPANFGAPSDNGDGTAALSGAIGYKAESGRKLTVKDTVTSAQNSSNAFTINPADVASFTFSRP